MRKRLLSLFLAVCTVFLSIPLTVLPTLAASASDSETIVLHSTRFAPDEASTWPTFAAYDISTMAQFSCVPVTYNGGWQIGSLTGSGSSATFAPFTGLYKASGSEMILSSSTGWWETHGGMYVISPKSSDMKNTLFSGIKYDADRTYVEAHRADAAIRYTADRSGTVTIDVTELYMYAEGSAYFDIYHNGTRLGDAFLADRDSRYYVNSAGTGYVQHSPYVNQADNIEKFTIENVKAGDTFDFVSRGNDAYGTANYTAFNYNYSKRGVFDFDIQIEYIVQKESYTTRFARDEASTWPIVESYTLSALETGDTLPVTFQGGWQVGYKSLASDATADNFTPYTSLIKMDPSNMVLSVDNTAWDNWGGMYMNTGASTNLMFSGIKYNKSDYSITSYNADSTIRYTAEYTGTAVIRLNELYFYADNTTAFEILHNSASGTTSLTGRYAASNSQNRISESGAWYEAGAGNRGADLGLLIVDLTAGDTLDFVNRGNADYVAAQKDSFGLTSYGAAEYNYAKRGVRDFDIEINYLGDRISQTTESWTGTPDSISTILPLPLFTWQETFTYTDENGKTKTGVNDDSYAIINRTLISSGIIPAATDSFSTILEKYAAYLKTFTSITYGNNWSLGAIVNGDYKESNRMAFVADRTIYALHTTGGTVDARPTTGAVLYSWDQQFWTYQAFTESAIDNFVSYPEYWPTSGTTAEDMRIYYSQIGTGTNLTMSDTQPFGGTGTDAGLRYANKSLYLRPNANGRMGAFAYTVPEGVDLGILSLSADAISFCEGSSFRYAIAVNGEVVYPAGATLTTGSVLQDEGQNGAWAVYTSLADLQAVFDRQKLEVTAGDLVEFCVARPADGSNKPSVNLSLTATVDNYNTVCAVDFVQSGERLYTDLVPFGETVDVTALGLPADFGVNGVYVNSSQSLEELPTTLTVNSDMRITDYALETTASFSINSAFAFNLYVKARSTATEAGVIIGGVKYPGNSLGNGMYKYTISGIAPKDIPVKSVAYKAYETVDGKDVVSPQTLTISAEDLLATYMQSSDPTLATLATSIWHYSLAARDYFINKNITISADVKNALRGRATSNETGTVDAALLEMVAGYQAGTAYRPYPDGVDINDYTYKFNGAGLVLADRLAFAFRIMRTDGNSFGNDEAGFRIRVQDENGETLRYATAHDFFDSSNSELLYYVENIPATEYGRELYFTLVDANDHALSATLTYSVHAFLARMHNTANGDTGTIHYLFRGIYQFGEATQAYMEAHSLNYDTDIVFPVGDGGDTLDGSAVLTERTYDTDGATAVTASTFLSSATATKGVYTAGNSALTLSGLTGTYDCKYSTLIASGGLVIENCDSLYISYLVVDGPVSIINSTNITLNGVQIKAGGAALTIDANTVNTMANACRLVGNTAVANAGKDTAIYASYLGFTTYGVQDADGSGTTVQNCRLVGTGTAIHSSTSESAFRFLTIEMSRTADYGIVLEGGGNAQNLLIAQNVITGTRNSISISGVDNASVVLNSAVSIEADGNTHLYICDNALAGRLTVQNNSYLLADGNTYPDDQKDHASVQSNNQNTNGDNLMDVDARLATGADMNLLPHVDKDQFLDMERKETVKDITKPSATSAIYPYIESQATTSTYVVVAPGAYVTSGAADNDRALNFFAAQSNTTVYAYGVYVEMQATDQAATSLTGHVGTSGTSNVTLKGFTLGYEMQASGQVYVVEKLDATNQLRVIAGAGMMNEFGNTNADFYNTTGFYLHRLSKGEFSPFCDLGLTSIAKQDDGTMLITVEAYTYELISKGDVLTCRAAGGKATVQTNVSSNILFKDMVVYGSSGGLCFVEVKNPTATTYYRVADTNRPGAVITAEEYAQYQSWATQYGVDFEIEIDEAGRYRGSVAHISSIDATHTSSSKQGSQIISCLFENMCDDGTNQKSTHARLASAVDNGDGTTTITYKGNLSPNNYGSYKYDTNAVCYDFSVGDRVMIYTAAGQLVCDTEALTATVALSAQASTYLPENLEKVGLTEAEFVPAQVPYKQITVATSAVNFDALDGYDLADDSYYAERKVLVDNLAQASNGFLIDNTVVDGTRSRGLLLKSSDGVVSNCTFRNTAKIGIAVIYEIHWGESGISERLVIKNNLIDNTSYSPKPNGIYLHYPIYIAGLSNDTLETDHMLNNNITISGNKVLNNHAEHALYIRSARDVYIYNNDFGTALTETAADPKASLYLNSVLNVELSGNTYSPYISDIKQAVTGAAYDNLFGSDFEKYPYHDAEGTLHIRYQDTFTFPYAVTAIDHVAITSKVTGTDQMDANLLILREDGKSVYADACGSAVVHLANGTAVSVTIEPSAISMFFVTGQSNASGDIQSGLPDDYTAQYANDYIRSPETMAYFSWCGQTISIDIEGDTALYQQAIDEDGKAIWHSESDVAAGKALPTFTDYRLNIPTTLDWETTSSAGCNPRQLTIPKGQASFRNAGWCAALAYEWIQQTGERVWIVNASQGSMEIQHFLPSEDGSVVNNEYYQAVAVFNLALETLYKEIDAGHFTLSHMAYYWFHGESNSATGEIAKGEYTGWENRFKADRGNRYLEAEQYTEYFTRMHEGFMNDVKYVHNGVTHELEYCGIMTVRTKVNETQNTFDQIVMSGARTSQYYMGTSNVGALSNVFVASNVTERWVGSTYDDTAATNPEADAAVEAYFLETYGSAEAFERIFGYAMPTTVYEMHPGVHYLMHGHNEMGMDCARNTLRIINARGIGKTYPGIDYAESSAYTVRLLGEDGRTEYTGSIEMRDDGVVILPKIDPIWQGWQGVSLVSETEGFYFDNFKLYRTDPSKISVTFSLYVGNQKVQTYTLKEKIVSAFSDYKPLYTKDTSTGSNVYTLNGMQAPWGLGYVNFADKSFHLYDVITSDGLLTTSVAINSGLSSHNDYGSFFVSNWRASLYHNQNAVSTLCYTAQRSGTISVSAESFTASANDNAGVYVAILKNGTMIWPTAGGALNYTKEDWYFAEKGVATRAVLNEEWADLLISVEEGDLIQFCLGGDNRATGKIKGNSQPTLYPVIEYED